MLFKSKNYLCIILLLSSQSLWAQPIPQRNSDFDRTFNKDTKADMASLKNYMDEKDSKRQDILDEIDDINTKLKEMNINTIVMFRAKNSIQSILKNRPADSLSIDAKDLGQDVITMATKFGRGVIPTGKTRDSIKYNLTLVSADIAAAEAKLDDYDSALVNLNHNLKIVNSDRQKAENMIQNIYNVEKGNQDFKTRVSLYFSGIICVLLIMFFVFIYLKSEHGVANEFLSGNGIQFVALFSLIIAIVLFGILGILEGRELAAILSGISGFILGKGITKSEDKKPAHAPGAGLPHEPTAPVKIPVVPEVPVTKNDTPSAN